MILCHLTPHPYVFRSCLFARVIFVLPRVLCFAWDEASGECAPPPSGRHSISQGSFSPSARRLMSHICCQVLLSKLVTRAQCRNQALHPAWSFKGAPWDLWYLCFASPLLQIAKEKCKLTPHPPHFNCHSPPLSQLRSEESVGTADRQEWSREKSKKSQTALSAGLTQATEKKNEIFLWDC